MQDGETWMFARGPETHWPVWDMPESGKHPTESLIPFSQLLANADKAPCTSPPLLPSSRTALALDSTGDTRIQAFFVPLRETQPFGNPPGPWPQNLPRAWALLGCTYVNRATARLRRGCTASPNLVETLWGNCLPQRIIRTLEQDQITFKTCLSYSLKQKLQLWGKNILGEHSSHFLVSRPHSAWEQRDIRPKGSFCNNPCAPLLVFHKHFSPPHSINLCTFSGGLALCYCLVGRGREKGVRGS